MTNIIKLQQESSPHLIPNIIVSLKDGIIINGIKNLLIPDLKETNTLFYGKNQQGSFQFLLQQLDLHITNGITTPDSPIRNYILDNNSLSIISQISYIGNTL